MVNESVRARLLWLADNSGVPMLEIERYYLRGHIEIGDGGEISAESIRTIRRLRRLRRDLGLEIDTAVLVLRLVRQIEELQRRLQ